MSITTDRLHTAAFPEDYAEILIETLGIGDANFLAVKDALHHFRHLDDDRASEAMRHIAGSIRVSGGEDRRASPKREEADGRLIAVATRSLAACRMVVERWEHGDLAEAARACQDAVDAYEAA